MAMRAIGLRLSDCGAGDMKRRRTSAQTNRNDLLPFDILKAVYDKHYAETNCRECAADRTREDVLATLDESILVCCPNVFDLCANHQPVPDGSDTSKTEASSHADDDDL